jgi:hypothetical protein
MEEMVKQMGVEHQREEKEKRILFTNCNGKK